ncbi:MAG: MFS transporter [Candidatus Dormibacteraeota bacterium]|nr:MFS transporter [Candidatus Dormibacteraeota bacterium]
MSTRLARLAGGTFSSLSIRNYRLFFGGQVVSVTGSWMQRVAQSWLVLHLTGSGVALGIVTALQFVPMLFFGLWGGVVADRADKRHVLYATQAAMGLLAALLGALTLSGSVRLWMVYALALILGLATAVDNPTRQAFVMEMVGRAHVMNAVSLNSAVFTGARVIGPALAGILVGLVGTGWCFILNAISFGAVIAALALMDPAALNRAPLVARSKGQVVEGLRYAWSEIDLRVTLLTLAAVGTLGLNFTVILPLLASVTFHGDATTYGLLFSVMGAGSVVGALATARLRTPSWPVLAGALGAFGLLMLAAAFAPSLWLEVAVLAPLGLATIVYQATTNSRLQLHSRRELRGRVMALYAVVFLGSTPIGAPIVGWVSQRYGPRAGLLLGAVAVLATWLALTAWLVRRRQTIRRAATATVRPQT